MLKNVLRNLMGAPSTRRYPYVTREPFADARGKITLDLSQCAFCGACAKRCPAGALAVSRADKQVRFEPFRCIVCEACREVCPRHSIGLDLQYRTPAYAKNVEVYQAESNEKAAATAP